MYYDIGIVLYTPSLGMEMDECYFSGDVVPILATVATRGTCRQVYWMENTIIGLKVGDPIAFKWAENIMYPIKVIDGLGVRVIGLDFDVLDKT